MTRTAQAPEVVAPAIATYPLLAALIGRRSRRFATGAVLDGGPLTHASRSPAEPLTLEEEAALAFAAAGITGSTLAELPYASGMNRESGCGNIIVHFVGRTVPSGDALHSVTLFVWNDTGTWMVRRPQDVASEALAPLVAAGKSGRLVEAYERSRVQVLPSRPSVPRKVPMMAPFNLWDSNLPGTTYFLPVTEITSLYINVLLTAFSDELGYFVVDDHAGYRPAGLQKFARSRRGHLHDDQRSGRVLTVSYLETALATIAAAEEGAMHQNLALMAEALGLGGFTHACRHPDWLTAIGFETTPVRLSRMMHAGFLTRSGMRLLGRADDSVALPVGLRHPARPDEWLLRAFVPPHYRDMRSAVLAFVDYKFGDGGTLRASGSAAWHDGAAVARKIPEYPQHAIDATIAYCEYLYDRYGRFPSNVAPFENMLAYQAHHVDVEFYDRFYSADVLGARQRAHQHT